MSKDYKVYLNDILKSVKRIEKYTKSIKKAEFTKDELKVDGVVRNLEIIGEAVKNIPENVRSRYPGIEWKKIAGLRDLLIHEYFAVDLDILWDIVEHKIPELKKKVNKILKDYNQNH